MIYAKINGSDLIKFPYKWDDLKQENPFTYYDNRFDLISWYAQTEEAETTGNEIVLVTIQAIPEIDSNTQNLVQPESPVLENGEWTLRYGVVDKTQEELDEIKSRPIGL